ncbi:MAG: glycosyltransferase family 4 protein [Candidatus Kerfeldbacteria bacterium]|nr:glycosyltransferase family 4 protein [Candidatus Kerfeldbacteria bacterium]
MKICFVNNLFPPVAQGGTEVVVQTTIDLLRQRGHNVILITTSPTRTREQWSIETSLGFSIYRFRPKNLYYYTEGYTQPVWKKLLWHAFDIINPLAASTLEHIIRQENPDLVHGHNLKGMSYTLPRVCAKLGIPYVHTLHNYQLLHPYGTFLYNQPPPYFSPRIAAWLYQAINKRQFRPTRLVVSPSNYVLAMHVRAGFFTASEKQILPSGIKLPTEGHMHRMDDLPLRLVYVGALEHIKGIRQLIASVKRLPEQTVSLDIYGTGSLQLEVAREITGRKNIQMRGYLKDKNRLRSYNVLVFPSICYETQGLVVLEALSYGLSVIASNIGGPTEVIEPGVNGLLVPAGNVEALTQGILKLANDRKTLRDLQSQTRKSVEKYSLADYASRLLAIYHSVVGGVAAG